MAKRIFVSIDIPEDIKAYLQNLQVKNIYWIKWMAAANFHITLSFLGDLETPEIEKAKEILESLSAAAGPFDLFLDEIQGVRDMLWVAPQKTNALKNLQSDLKSAFKNARIGKREKRNYSAHVLLGRSKTGRFMSWRPKNFRGQIFRVKAINLYESLLTPGAATHRLIQSFSLRNKNL